MKVCPICGVSYDKKTKYCSKQCQHISMQTYNYDKNNPPCCKYCNTVLTHRLANTGATFCSMDCRKHYLDKLQEEKLNSVQGKVCEICNKPLTDKQCLANVRTCSAKCAYELRVKLYGAVSDANPEKFVQYSITNELRKDEDYCKSKSKSFKNLWKNPEFRKCCIDRMIQDNPSSNPEVVNKIKCTKSQKGIANVFLGVRGGNGHITKHEALLMDFCTSLGFEYNKAINTYSLRKQFPEEHFAFNYKPDFVNLKYKLCIEVDGIEHRLKSSILKDQKKEKCLGILGYKFLRFTNEQIDSDINNVQQQILNCLRNEGYVDG